MPGPETRVLTLDLDEATANDLEDYLRQIGKVSDAYLNSLVNSLIESHVESMRELRNLPSSNDNGCGGCGGSCPECRSIGGNRTSQDPHSRTREHGDKMLGRAERDAETAFEAAQRMSDGGSADPKVREVLDAPTRDGLEGQQDTMFDLAERLFHEPAEKARQRARESLK